MISVLNLNLNNCYKNSTKFYSKMSGTISILSRKLNLLDDLQNLLPNTKFHVVQNPEHDEQMFKSEVLIADYDLLGPHLYNLPNAKWVQGTWAGIEVLMKHVKPDRIPPLTITRFSGRHFGDLMSEYVVANIINTERDFFKMKMNQAKCEWNRDGKIFVHKRLSDLHVGVMGLGTLGNRIAKALSNMGAKIVGYSRKPNIDLNENKHILKYFNSEQLKDFLKSCDYFINVLPDGPESRYLLNGNVLENCKEKQAIFVNIGRGTICSESVLVKALEEKWLGGAILDVFEEEPLRAESPLWKMENVFITPHIAGVSHAKDIAEVFKENYELYLSKQAVPPVVDFVKGY